MELPVLELTRGQILTRIERSAKQRGLLYSAVDLIRAYKAGEFHDTDVVALASLLPDDDPLFIRL
jgi:hypothetical protein